MPKLGPPVVKGCKGGRLSCYLTRVRRVMPKLAQNRFACLSAAFVCPCDLARLQSLVLHITHLDGDKQPCALVKLIPLYIDSCQDIQKDRCVSRKSANICFTGKLSQIQEVISTACSRRQQHELPRKMRQAAVSGTACCCILEAQATTLANMGIGTMEKAFHRLNAKALPNCASITSRTAHCVQPDARLIIRNTFASMAMLSLVTAWSQPHKLNIPAVMLMHTMLS